MLRARQSKQSRWFPTKEQLKDHGSLERSLRQMLEQHYALVDRVNAHMAKQTTQSTAGSASTPPAGSGPADTMLLGLRVAPIDTNTLADGTQLTYVKAQGNFQFL